MFRSILIFAPPLLLSVILHEVAHGYAAERLGDSTARRQGRLSLNPIRHIDPFMTILVPALFILAGSPFVFGGAKPVPVNPLYFKNPRRGMAWVALAGPLVNFTLAALSYGLLSSILHLGGDLPAYAPLVILLQWLDVGIVINLVLGIFNLLPIPPLDGGRIAVGFLPEKLARPLARIERYGILIVIAIIYSLHSLI